MDYAIRGRSVGAVAPSPLLVAPAFVLRVGMLRLRNEARCARPIASLSMTGNVESEMRQLQRRIGVDCAATQTQAECLSAHVSMKRPRSTTVLPSLNSLAW